MELYEITLDCDCIEKVHFEGLLISENDDYYFFEDTKDRRIRKIKKSNPHYKWIRK